MKVMWPSGYTNKEKIKCTKDCVCAYENIRVILGFLSGLYYLFHSSWSIISYQNCLLLITIAQFLNELKIAKYAAMSHYQTNYS